MAIVGLILGGAILFWMIFGDMDGETDE